METQKVQYIYPTKVLNSFIYKYPYMYLCIKNIYKKIIFNYILVRNNSMLYKLYDVVHKCRVNKKSKTRAEVVKSNKKPWPQKKLGKARVGSFKSPLWVGGGVIFGPTPKLIKLKINKKFKKVSVMYVLLQKRSQIHFVFLYSIFHSFYTFEEYINQQLRIYGLFIKKVMCVSINNKNTYKCSSFKLVSIKTLNIQKLIQANFIIFLL